MAIKRLLLLVALSLLPWSGAVSAQGAQRDFAMPDILGLREQAAVRDAWLERRLATVLPALMRKHDIDLWLIIGREYMEDPVLSTMLPSVWLSARRRTVLMISARDDGSVETLSVARYPAGNAFPSAWDPEQQPDQWARIAELVAERDPRRVAINTSTHWALADGLTASEERALLAALPPTYRDRLVSGEKLALGWLETRIPEEMAVYPTLQRIANAIIAEGLSEKVITPGVTGTDDVVWWYRERIRELGLETWFHPSVQVQRADDGAQDEKTMFGSGSLKPEYVILPGDLIHVDFGIRYLGLTTDTQNHAYVLRPGETDAPAGLRAGHAAVGRVADLIVENFRAGEPANDLLMRVYAQAQKEGHKANIYTHGVGFHGHGAGPWVGAWDLDGPIPVVGDYPTNAHTFWAIELNVEQAVPEWGGKVVRFMLEDGAYFDGEKAWFVDQRPQQMHLIPRR